MEEQSEQLSSDFIKLQEFKLKQATDNKIQMAKLFYLIENKYFILQLIIDQNNKKVHIFSIKNIKQPLFQQDIDINDKVFSTSLLLFILKAQQLQLEIYNLKNKTNIYKLAYYPVNQIKKIFFIPTDYQQTLGYFEVNNISLNFFTLSNNDKIQQRNINLILDFKNFDILWILKLQKIKDQFVLFFNNKIIIIKIKLNNNLTNPKYKQIRFIYHSQFQILGQKFYIKPNSKLYLPKISNSESVKKYNVLDLDKKLVQNNLKTRNFEIHGIQNLIDEDWIYYNKFLIENPRFKFKFLQYNKQGKSFPLKQKTMRLFFAVKERRKFYEEENKEELEYILEKYAAKY